MHLKRNQTTTVTTPHSNKNDMIIPDSSTTKYERHVTYRCVCVCVYLGQDITGVTSSGITTNQPYYVSRRIPGSSIYCFITRLLFHYWYVFVFKLNTCPFKCGLNIMMFYSKYCLLMYDIRCRRVVNFPTVVLPHSSCNAN